MSDSIPKYIPKTKGQNSLLNVLDCQVAIGAKIDFAFSCSDHHPSNAPAIAIQGGPIPTLDPLLDA
jgi:hypothetical protein